MSDEANQYEIERRDKRQKLRDLGLDPYGQRTPGIQPLAEVKQLYKTEYGHDSGPLVKVSGRVMLKRDMGKLSFLTLRDDSGDLQVALDKKRLSETNWEVRNLIDLGDQIVVEGPLGTTNKGETTVWGTSLSMASKALLPPPAKWEGLSDVEARYRQRYLDLWANPEVMRTMQLRIRIVDEIRIFMRSRGFLEVETPMMQVMHGGAAARPFETHHNALDMPLFMRIAPELYLKRLLVGGFKKVFELNRNFRNEGISPRHNPEFTMLEAYEAFGSWETMADLVEEMITTIAQNVLGTLEIKHKSGRTINLTRPWRRVKMTDLVVERTGFQFNKEPMSAEQIEKLRAANPGKDLKLTTGSPAEQLVEVYEKLIEPTLIDPCYVTHVPSVVIPLARPWKEDPFFADVYELAINGQEISPGYTELNDPDVQEAQFGTQVGDEAEKQKVDHDFLNALKYGMPPAGGMGMGIDRLVMMLLGAESIRDVILFPLMRPQE
jgi:lysyl-tRNA synthetase class 2